MLISSMPLPKKEECYFYHTIDLPKHGTIHGSWDLREGFDEYIGMVNVKDKRVLDVGTGTGFLSFETEKRGAKEVISFDLSQEEAWDYTPYTDRLMLETFGCTLQEAIDDKRKCLLNQYNGYWFSHNALNSKAKMCYGSIYKIPEEVISEVSIVGSILLHVQFPLKAIERIAELTEETIIVTEPYYDHLNNSQAICELIPTANPPLVLDTWWRHTPMYISNYLKILGFRRVYTMFHEQTRDEMQQTDKFFTVVGQR